MIIEVLCIGFFVTFGVSIWNAFGLSEAFTNLRDLEGEILELKKHIPARSEETGRFTKREG